MLRNGRETSLNRNYSAASRFCAILAHVAKRIRKHLTPKQRKFLKALPKARTHGEAALKAGYSSKYPDQSARQALAALRLSVPQLMDRAGLSEGVLIQKYLAPLLKAKTTRFFHHQGEVIETHDVADNETRRNALETAFKLHGSFAPLKQETTARTISVVVLDVPRPGRPVGASPPAIIDVAKPNGNGSNGHKPNGNGAKD